MRLEPGELSGDLHESDTKKKVGWSSSNGAHRKGESMNPNLIPLGTPPSKKMPPSSPSASSVASFASCHSEFEEEEQQQQEREGHGGGEDESNDGTHFDLEEDDEMKTESRQELESIYGKLEFSIEKPCKVNGENFQIRTMIYDQLFIGRSPTMKDATERCCLKAVKYIKQHKLGPFAKESVVCKKEKKRKRKSKKGGTTARGKGSKEDDQEEEGESDEKKMDFRNIPIKNAIMMLNEMFPPPKAPQYKVLSQTGPPNNPTFTMMCTIENKSYVGEGKSKKEAKLVSSQKAIEVLCGYKRSETRSVPEKSNPRANCDLDDWMELEGKNPVSILNELYPGIQYQLLSTTGPSHAPNFIIKAMLNNMSFEGSGKSKKDAKLNASKALLVHLHKVGFDPMTGDMMSTRENNDAAAIGHTFADQISQLVHSKYQELFGTTTYSKRRVMAAIVMTEEEKEPTVIAVTSGTKCINGEQISLEGCVINDSHAEIVARRCLVLFLYSQLEKLTDQEEGIESIFYRLDGHSRCFLKSGVEFHLFITTSPCGDARIFSLHETSSNGSKGAKDKQQPPKDEDKVGAEAKPEREEVVKKEEEEGPLQMENESNSSGDERPAEDCNNNIEIPKVELMDYNNNNCTSVQLDQVDENNNSVVVPMSSCTDHSQESELPIVDINNNVEAPSSSKDNKTICDVIEEEEVASENDANTAANDATAEPLKAATSSTSLNENDSQSNTVVEKRSNDSSRGMLRSKIECGMGTVPISPKVQIQTWDGVMSGDRLLTMACSDKLLRWNVLGVQGACLTHLVYPIYFSTVTVGSKFHPGHMKRALYDRIQPYINDLPKGYQMNNADLLATTSPETRQATKAHDYSVNWVLDHGQPEIVNGSTGKTINDSVSRLSKKMLFQKFLDLNGRILKVPFRSPCRYSEVKQMASDYQEAKTVFNLALKDAGCGVWIDKPIEQDQFSL